MVTRQLVSDPKSEHRREFGLLIGNCVPTVYAPLMKSWSGDATACVVLQIQLPQSSQGEKKYECVLHLSDREAKPASGLGDKLKSINTAVLT